MLDPEAEATIIRRRAKLDVDEPYGAFEIAQALELGIAYYPHHVLRGLDSTLFWPRGRSKPAEIALRRGLMPVRKAWCIVHEVGEDHLDRIEYREPDVEQMANAIAAALLMPHRCFRDVARDTGPDLVELADQFAASETSVALRLAEVGAVEASAVVTPVKVYARSREEWVWPTDLRRAARHGHPGLRKVHVSDERRRVVLLA